MEFLYDAWISRKGFIVNESILYIEILTGTGSVGNTISTISSGNVTISEIVLGGTTNASLTSDKWGGLYFKFSIPSGRFATGDKIIKLSDVDDPFVESNRSTSTGIYSAIGLTHYKQRVTTNTTVTTVKTTKTVTTNKVTTNNISNTVNKVIVTNIHYNDPLAQTFIVSDEINPSGVFISSIDLFFKNKPIEPIPLTEKWLLKFRFEKSKRFELGELKPCYVIFSLAVMIRHNSFFVDWIGGNNIDEHGIFSFERDWKKIFSDRKIKTIIEATQECESCGFTFPEVEKFCPNCGEKVPEKENLDIEKELKLFEISGQKIKLLPPKIDINYFIDKGATDYETLKVLQEKWINFLVKSEIKQNDFLFHKNKGTFFKRFDVLLKPFYLEVIKCALLKKGKNVVYKSYCDKILNKSYDKKYGTN